MELPRPHPQTLIPSVTNYSNADVGHFCLTLSNVHRRTKSLLTFPRYTPRFYNLCSSSFMNRTNYRRCTSNVTLRRESYRRDAFNEIAVALEKIMQTFIFFRNLKDPRSIFILFVNLYELRNCLFRLKKKLFIVFVYFIFIKWRWSRILMKILFLFHNLPFASNTRHERLLCYDIPQKWILSDLRN